MSIGQNIKKYRKEKGLTQRELADRIGVSVQAVSKWETDTGAPDISQVVPLASALDISTDALFEYTRKANPEDFREISKDYYRQEVFREQKISDKDYDTLCSYFSVHPQNSEAASLCLKCLVDRIVAGKVQDRAKSELVAECEKYANCVFKYETDADTIFMNHFVLARGYSALGENEKAKEILGKVPVTFGDRLYWEAEIAQANKDYDEAMLKCRSSFALKARYISRCIRMAGEIYEERDGRAGLMQRMEYEEYMLRLLNAFLSGGDYLPCRQVYQKYILLKGMVRRYIALGEYERAIEKAELIFEGRNTFYDFLHQPYDKASLLFENNDSIEYQMWTAKELDSYVQTTVNRLKGIPDYARYPKIKELFEKYGFV